MEAAQPALDNSRTYFLICGIVNLIASVCWALVTVFGGLATCCFGCLLGVLPVIHLAVMVFDFVAASSFSKPPTPAVYSFLKFVAILDIVAGLAVVPLVLGILNLQLLSQPGVYAHFHRAESV